MLREQEGAAWGARRQAWGEGTVVAGFLATPRPTPEHEPGESSSLTVTVLVTCAPCSPHPRWGSLLEQTGLSLGAST